jgi:creatinine amidohydrolase
MPDVDTALLLTQMTSQQVAAEIARGRTTVVVPFGALEQHGPHLPLDTDAILGDRLGPMLAQRLDALCAPTLRVGCSWHHLAFAGTLSIRPETLLMIVEDLVDSLTRHGFRRIVLLPTHGGNEGPLLKAAQRSRRDRVTIIVPSLRATVEALLSRARSRGVVPGDAGGHAGELETSLLLALAPNLVQVDMLEPGYTGPLDDAAVAVFFGEGVHALSANGVLGDPRGASAEAGRAYIAAFLDATQAAVEREARTVDPR